MRSVPVVCGALLLVAAPAAAGAPLDRAGRPQGGGGSFSGPKAVGKPTASGAPLDPQALTAASRTLPRGAKAEVVNKDTGKSVTVTVNDRGPYAQARIVDVTPKAAEKLGMTQQGVANVVVKPLAEPPPK